MRGTKGIWLAAASGLIAAGLLVFVLAMSKCGWDFSKLSAAGYETNTHETGEAFSSISIETDTAGISFVAAEDGVCRVVCREQKDGKHSVEVRDGVLCIRAENHRKWYDYIMNLDLGSTQITVYLPKGEYEALSIEEDTGNVGIPKDFSFEEADIVAGTGSVEFLANVPGRLKIETATGSIKVEGISAGALELSAATGAVTASDISCAGDMKISADTGRISLKDIGCRNFESDGGTGAISLESVTATEKLFIQRGTGSVRFDACDAAEIFVTTGTGRVSGSLLSEKVFITESGTGRVSVPKTTNGGRCEISTGTGDIEIEIAE